MNTTYNFDHEVFKTASELPTEIHALIELAHEQTKLAYAPYSDFYVGAAILLESGEIYVGCNQENASYPLCMCAERVALYSMGAEKEDFKIKALAITATNRHKPLKEVCMPCGACRQVIQEFEDRMGDKITLYLTSEKNEILKIKGIDNILPFSFSKRHVL